MDDAVLDPQPQAPSSLEVDAELTENVAALLDAGQEGMVLNLVADLYPADIARLMTHLSLERARQLLHWLPEEDASEVLVELDSGVYRTDLLEAVAAERLRAMIDELDTDDAADVLADLPDDLVLEVLPQLEDAEEVGELLRYDEESAGGLMDTEYVAALPGWTVGEVTEEVRSHAEDVDIYGVFVTDADGRLLGIASLKQILLSPSDIPIGDILDEDILSVRTDMDQEEVARIMERYDLVSLPVVDDADRLVGRITIDDVVDVIREEAEEDMQRMSGIAGDEEPTDSVWRITKGRLPWLLVGMVGAVLSGLVIGGFEDALQEAVVLAFFIPVVMAMAGNAGIQSSAIVVQGLASGDVWDSDLARRLSKEVAVALINGVVLGIVLIGVVLLLVAVGFWGDGGVEAPLRLAVTASLALLLVILMATCIGSTVPLGLHRVGIDPALATGPFITTSNDILGLMVFFLLASLLYLS